MPRYEPMDVIQMRKDRTRLLDEAKTLIDTASRRENRSFTKDEQTRFDRLHEDIDGRNNLIERAERQNESERRNAELRINGRLDALENRAEDEVPAGPVLEKRHSMTAWARANGHDTEELRGLTFGSLVRAMVRGPKTDVERRALAEGSDSTGGVTVPIFTSALFFDKLRAAAVCFRAGATMVPLDTDKTKIARLNADVPLGWKSENSSIATGDPTFQTIQFDAQTLTGRVTVSREILEDTINLDQMLENAFLRASAVELDRACLVGSGTPPEPQGIFGTSGIGSVDMGANGATLAASSGYSKLLDTYQALLDANASAPTAWVMAPRTAVQLAKLADTTNQPMQKPVGLEAPFYATTAIPTNQVLGSSGSVCSSIIAGNFPELLIGIRTQFRLGVFRELSAATGQVDLISWMRADVQLAHPASFARLRGII